jgi:pimeloyl-ACP methyl ester carboxylesterase
LGHQQKKPMSTFVLIHGSWHSAWNWHKVVPILEKSGHKAIAIDLPGMGRDKTPIETVSLELSVKKVVDIVQKEEGRVILVGHSKNGIIISQAAEYIPERIEKLIYLAAYLVPNGKTQAEYSVLDTAGVLKPYVIRYPGSNSHTLDSIIYKEGLYHDCDPDITEMAKYILNHEPVATGITPLILSNENYGRIPRYYIECTEDRAVTPFIQRKMYTETPCKQVYQMATSHSPFFSRPEELCEIFLKIGEDEIIG